MAHTTDFDRTRRRVRIRYHGTVNAHEYFEVIDELARLDGFDEGVDGMSVFTGAEVEIDPAEVHEVVGRLQSTMDFSSHVWAFVIEEPRQVAIGLVYQMAVKGMHEVEIFATEEAAEDWLDRRQGGTA